MDVVLLNIYGRYVSWQSGKKLVSLDMDAEHQRHASGTTSASQDKTKGAKWWHMPPIPAGIKLLAMNVEHNIERESALVIIVVSVSSCVDQS